MIQYMKGGSALERILRNSDKCGVFVDKSWYLCYNEIMIEGKLKMLIF